MAKYYLTQDLNQNFEQVIHRAPCLYMPDRSEMTYIGDFTEAAEALKESQKVGYKTNGCFWCCRTIHMKNNIKII